MSLCFSRSSSASFTSSFNFSVITNCLSFYFSAQNESKYLKIALKALSISKELEFSSSWDRTLTSLGTACIKFSFPNVLSWVLKSAVGSLTRAKTVIKMSLKERSRSWDKVGWGESNLHQVFEIWLFGDFPRVSVLKISIFYLRESKSRAWYPHWKLYTRV